MLKYTDFFFFFNEAKAKSNPPEGTSYTYSGTLNKLMAFVCKHLARESEKKRVHYTL